MNLKSFGISWEVLQSSQFGWALISTLVTMPTNYLCVHSMIRTGRAAAPPISANYQSCTRSHWERDIWSYHKVYQVFCSCLKSLYVLMFWLVEFQYYKATIKARGCVSVAKKDMWCTRVIYQHHKVVDFSPSYLEKLLGRFLPNLPILCSTYTWPYITKFQRNQIGSLWDVCSWNYLIFFLLCIELKIIKYVKTITLMVWFLLNLAYL